jgi:hypothetical protein
MEDFGRRAPSTAGGRFRRFKDLLELDFPELRRTWFAFHDVRGERRAIEWLADRNLIGREAEEWIESRVAAA